MLGLNVREVGDLDDASEIVASDFFFARDRRLSRSRGVSSRVTLVDHISVASSSDSMGEVELDALDTVRDFPSLAELLFKFTSSPKYARDL